MIFYSLQLLQILITALTFGSDLVMSTPIPTVATCQDPTNLDAMWTQLQLDNHQNLLVPMPLNGDSNLKQSYENGTLIMGDKWCPTNSMELQSSFDSSLVHRSTCPYYYVMEIDSKRYPPAITEARCRCDKCLESSRRSEFNVCEPITLPVKLLRNTGTCVNGVWQYEPYTHHLTFACTCAVKRKHISGVVLPHAPSPTEDDPPPM